MPLVVGEDGVFVLPTQVKTRYAQFTGLEDADIEPYILEARLFVDTSWPAAARAPAQTHAAAHLMTLAGLGAGSSVGGVAVPTDREIASFRIDDLAVSFAAPGAAGGASSSGAQGWQTTPAGRQYEALRRRYFGGGIWVGA